jgi:hypothetical protein
MLLARFNLTKTFLHSMDNYGIYTSMLSSAQFQMHSLSSLVQVAWLTLCCVCVLPATCHQVWRGNAGTFILRFLEELLEDLVGNT